VRKRELEVLAEELLDVWAADVIGLLNLNDLEDLFYVLKFVVFARLCFSTHVDVPEARAVTGGHVLVERVDGLSAGHLAVLLVHVVGARARVVADPDTEVLDLQGVLLMDLSQ
jgi:hypothetical protein